MHLCELERRHDARLLEPSGLTWLEREGLMLLSEERARLLAEDLQRD